MDAIAAAERIAQDVLLPAAEAVDRADRVPVEHFDLLGREGLYGLAGPQAAGRDALGAVVEALASGCLATTFVWLQHHGALAGAAGSARPEVRERWVRPLATGERRAGIALAGLRPDPAPLRVRADGGPGFVLSGEVAWVTGWDMIDTVYLAARDADDLVHFFLLDAVAGDTLSARPLELIAAQASRTVTLRFDGHRVPAERLVGTQPYADWAGADAFGSALNGFLALGVARRCCRLLGPSPLDERLAACRAALTAAMTGSGGGVPAARAAASELAWRAAAKLAVRTGSRAALAGGPSARLSREATFLLVFGSRPAIRDALDAHLDLAPNPAILGLSGDNSGIST